MAISDDLYMILNIDRTANHDEIRRAYLRLALCLHPDKAAARHAVALQQQDQNDGPVLDLASRQASVQRVRKVADEQFVRVERAHRVLCDPVKRLVYDEYGFEGLEAFEQNEMSKQSLAMPYKHPVEIRRLLDSLLREAAQNRRDVALSTFGGITAECRCLPIVDAHGRLVKRNILPELTRLTVQQSVQVPVAEKTNLTFGGYSLHHSGLGIGSVYLSSQHDLSDTQWVGSLVQLGQQPKIGVSCGSSGGGGTSVQSHCTYEPESGLGFRLSTSERLNPATVVDASWGVTGGKRRGAADDPVTLQVTRLVGDGNRTLHGELAIGHQSWMDLGLRIAYRHSLSPSRTVHIGGKIGVRGMEVELDSCRALRRQVTVKIALRLGDEGVLTIFSLHRGGMVFEAPVLLSTLFTGWTLACGWVIPALADAGVGWLLSSVWRRRRERLEAEERLLRLRRLAKAWEDAASQARLMEHMAIKKRSRETEQGGMVILLARYGASLSRDCGRQWWAQAPEPGVGMPLSGLVAAETPQGAAAAELVSQPNVDVTVPLQFFVNESTLSLTAGSKSHLLGFFTPAPCQEKNSPEFFVGDERRATYRERERFSGGGSSSSFEGGGGAGIGGWALPQDAPAKLYIRYSFAGRTFEETFEDIHEVELPSPTSTHLGDSDVR